MIIIGEEGEEHLWGLEDDESRAAAIAEEIQLELRAINYVRRSLQDTLREAMVFLAESGVPAEHLNDIACEGYRSVQRWLLELYDDSGENSLPV